MLAGMSASTLLGWQAYAALEPFGEYRAELRNGELCALTANINRDTKSRPEPYSLYDFTHFVERPEKAEIKLTPEEIERAMAGIFGA